MAWSAVSTAVMTIENLITKEATSLCGVEEQVQSLRRELVRMQSFLKDADSRNLWVSEIRELAYDAEDVVEAFAFKNGSKTKGGFLNDVVVKTSACICCLKEESQLLHKTRCDIDKIIAGINTLTQQLQAYGVKQGAEESSTSYHESSRPRIIEDDNVVGFDDDIKKLVSILVDNESNHRIVSICGIGGMGKTTLAKKVYHHSRVRGYFSHMAWVYVPQQCERRKIWDDILSGLMSPSAKGSSHTDGELAKKLSYFMKDKKCLVILDDIRTIEAWDSLKTGFPMTKTSSKILITSRNKEVLSHADKSGYLHELECLKVEDSWELFQWVAFPNRDSPDYRVDEGMKEMGKIMVKHCEGLPLAITVLGGILATKNALFEWQMVFDNMKPYLKRGKLVHATKNVLALSYDDLPSYLRLCFIYLSHFPEGYEIHAKRLIQLWVAEGILSSKQEEGNGGELLEHVAETYLNELVQRCMIQVRERDATSLKFKTIQMHDLIRELSLSKAKHENFLFIMDESFMLMDNNVVSSRIRGVSRFAAHHFFGIQRIKSPHLRSLLIFGDLCQKESHFARSVAPLKALGKWAENPGDVKLVGFCPPLFIPIFIAYLSSLMCAMHGIWTYMLKNFKSLRILEFEGDGKNAGYKLPTGIGNLIHLRFLSLRNMDFCSSELPSSLGNLRRLQTLDLRVGPTGNYPYFFDIHVPNVIYKMQELRHLYLPKRCKPKRKLNLGTLTKLQTLVNFSTRSCYVEDLINKTNLSELKIRLPFSVEDFKENLELKYLGSLCIKRSDGDGDDEEGIDSGHLAHLISSCVNICELSLRVKIRKLPEYSYLSSNIASILLENCLLKDDPMATLGKLPSLRIMELGYEAFIGKEMVCSAQSFPKLDSLTLSKLCSLEEWKVDEGAMPVLRHLEIHDCKILKKLPDRLRFIKTLKELKIDRMPKAFKDKMVEGGEDFNNVQHVPCIMFRYIL